MGAIPGFWTAESRHYPASKVHATRRRNARELASDLSRRHESVFSLKSCLDGSLIRKRLAIVGVSRLWGMGSLDLTMLLSKGSNRAKAFGDRA